MLSLKAMEFYSKINKNLLTIKGDIDFFKSAIPHKLEKSIILGVVTSSVILNSRGINYFIAGENNLRQEYLDAFSQFKSNFRPIEFDRRINSLKREVKELFNEYGYVDFQTNSILNDLEEISLKYQDIIREDQEKVLIVAFFEKLEILVKKYEALLIDTLSFKYAVQPNEDKTFDDKKMGIIELYIPGNFDVEYFVSIISDMSRAYSLLVQVFPTAEIKKLQYIKIETNSVFAKFFGDKKIIDILTILFSKIAQVAYHRTTNDGQLEKNGNYFEAINNALNVIEKAEESGINTEGAKIGVKKALETASEELAQIVKKAPGLELNGEKYGNWNAPKMLSEGKNGLLAQENRKENDSE